MLLQSYACHLNAVLNDEAEIVVWFVCVIIVEWH